MVLLALIALIVLGPEKLPGAARTAGALLRRVRSGWDNVRAEVERELEIEEIKRSARDAVASAETAQQLVKDALKQAHDPFAEAAAMVRLQPASKPALASPADTVPVESAVDTSPRDGATAASQSNEKTVLDHAHPSSADANPTPVAVAAASEPIEGSQSELPLGSPVTREDGPHGNA